MRHAVIIGLALMGLLVGTPAGALSINSGDGTESCATNHGAFPGELCGQGHAHKIKPHSVWQPPLGGAEWISYKDTGVGAGAELAPITAHTVPDAVPYLMQITESFVSTADFAVLNLTTWADDTTDLFIDGVQRIGPNFTQAPCAEGIIGCEPNESFALADYDLGPAGPHTIEWHVFQVGVSTDPQANPFGLLYTGTCFPCAPVAPVPEPATLVLVGTGLVGAVAWRRRRTA